MGFRLKIVKNTFGPSPPLAQVTEQQLSFPLGIIVVNCLLKSLQKDQVSPFKQILVEKHTKKTLMIGEEVQQHMHYYCQIETSWLSYLQSLSMKIALTVTISIYLMVVVVRRHL